MLIQLRLRDGGDDGWDSKQLVVRFRGRDG